MCIRDRYFAIAFPNGSGGFEVRNRYFKGCIAPKEIAHIRQSGKARNTCYVVEGFMDYLSFLTLRQESCPNYPELDGQDYIVLNSVSNVNKVLYQVLWARSAPRFTQRKNQKEYLQ